MARRRATSRPLQRVGCCCKQEFQITNYLLVCSTTLVPDPPFSSKTRVCNSTYQVLVLVLWRQRRDELDVEVLRTQAGGTAWRTEVVEKGGVSVDVVHPLVWDIVFVEDGLNRANGLAGTAVDALVGVDVEHPFALVNAVHGTFFDAGSIQDINAGLGDCVGHRISDTTDKDVENRFTVILLAPRSFTNGHISSITPAASSGKDSGTGQLVTVACWYKHQRQEAGDRTVPVHGLAAKNGPSAGSNTPGEVPIFLIASVWQW